MHLQKITRRLVRLVPGLVAAAVLTLAGCQTLREVAALRQVEFHLDRVSGSTLAGVGLDEVRSYGDLGLRDVARIGNAVREKSLPFSFTLHVNGRNPEDNSVQARLLQLDWTLFLEDRETVSGVFNEHIVLPPGQPVDVPIRVELDLYQFFAANARDLVELALNVAGEGGAPKNIRLSAVPTVDTPVGPIRYPGRIDIVSATVGTDGNN